MSSNGVLTCGAFFYNLLHVKQNNCDCLRLPKFEFLGNKIRDMRLKIITNPEKRQCCTCFSTVISALHLMLSYSARNFLLSYLFAKAKADSELILAKAKVKGMMGMSQQHSYLLLLIILRWKNTTRRQNTPCKTHYECYN